MKNVSIREVGCSDVSVGNSSTLCNKSRLSKGCNGGNQILTTLINKHSDGRWGKKYRSQGLSPMPVRMEIEGLSVFGGSL